MIKAENYFKILFRYLCKQTKKKHENFQQDSPPAEIQTWNLLNADHYKAGFGQNRSNSDAEFTWWGKGGEHCFVLPQTIYIIQGNEQNVFKSVP